MKEAKEDTNEWKGISCSRISRINTVRVLPRQLRGKNPLARQETQVQALSRKYPLEKEMATHSSIPAWESPWTESLEDYSPWGSHRVGHN